MHNGVLDVVSAGCRAACYTLRLSVGTAACVDGSDAFIEGVLVSLRYGLAQFSFPEGDDVCGVDSA